MEVCTAQGEQSSPIVISDSSEGAIVVWEDHRSGDVDIYAQRMTYYGEADWQDYGVAVCEAENDQRNPVAIPNGSGGAIVAWEDERNGGGDIYIQMVSSDGNIMGPPDGIPVCTVPSVQKDVVLVSDAELGAFIIWVDSRSGNWRIRAQRADKSCALLWPEDVALCGASSVQDQPVAVSDGEGGAIVAWRDTKRFVFQPTGAPKSAPQPDGIYIQKIGGSAELMWDSFGIPVKSGYNLLSDPAIATDRSGGAIVAWQEYCEPDVMHSLSPRSGQGNWDIYARRVDASGASVWPGGDLAVCTARANQVNPIVSPLGPGGALVIWRDHVTNNKQLCVRWITSLGEMD
jgi:hypothetical protein